MQNEYWCMNFQHIAFRCKIASTMQIKYVMMCCISACCEMSWFLFDFASAGLDWWYCIFLSQQRSPEWKKIRNQNEINKYWSIVACLHHHIYRAILSTVCSGACHCFTWFRLFGVREFNFWHFPIGNRIDQPTLNICTRNPVIHTNWNINKSLILICHYGAWFTSYKFKQAFW